MNHKRNLNGPIILIRGAGELATGVGWVLAMSGYRPVMTEVEQPLMVRWPVCFGSAVHAGSWQVENIYSRLISASQQAAEAWQQGEIPVIVDPELNMLADFKPAALVDAIMAKRNTGIDKEMARLVIGLGPGFTAGVDTDLVVETNRGHNLGRLIYSGTAEPNTGIPGEIGGQTAGRVVYSGIAGTFTPLRKIGDQVTVGDLLGLIQGPEGEYEVRAKINGVLRGLLQNNTWIEAQVKIGDIDPRGEPELCWTISDKARAIGCSVLLGILSTGIK